MDDATEYQALTALLKPVGQQHVLRFWDRLNGDQRAQLAGQLRKIDFSELNRLVKGTAPSEDWQALSARAVAPPAIRLDREERASSAAEARVRGALSLAAGQVGAVLVAGGQATRLGSDQPKGMYQVGPVSGASLFQILFEKLLAVGRRHGVTIPLYLMTSPATHDETVENLAANDHFGLAADDVHVFCQGTMPAVDRETGRLLLDAPGSLSLSPDGHGGLLAALASSGGIDAIKRRGLRHLFYFQVDNPLAPVCDAEMLGHHLLASSELTTLVIAKQFPTEKVGNVASVDGHLQIIEYSDLPREAAERKGDDGQLELWAGNTAIHVFDTTLLERVLHDRHALPFHIAKKAVAHLDERGERVEPSEPNAIKFERFIFDLLPTAKNAIVVEADPAQAFAPLKNAPGSERDSPETVRKQMVALHRSWLEAAGVRVAPGVEVEISPLAALDAEEAARKYASLGAVNKPVYLDKQARQLR